MTPVRRDAALFASGGCVYVYKSRRRRWSAALVLVALAVLAAVLLSVRW